MTKRKYLFLSVSMVALAGGMSEALAGAFALREQSAYYQGMAFAGNAAGGASISSMFWNPATLTNTIGLTFESHAALIVPDVEIKPDSSIPGFASGPSGEMGNDALVPASYTAYQVDENWYLGLAINSQFGLATKAGPTWGGQAYARTSEVFSVNANPTVAYKFNDMISVAVGLQIQYLDVRLTSAVSPVAGAGTGALSGDDIGVGFTAGVTLTPMDGTVLGLGFRSAVEHGLTGKFDAGGFSQDIAADLTLPEMVTFSVKQRVSDSFRVMGTVEWTNWSRLGVVDTRATGVATPIATAADGRDLHFNYDDAWFFSVGAEYDYNEMLTLRGGVAYEVSPIDTDIRSARLPDNDRVWLSAGLTYKARENLSFDLGYSYLFTPQDTRVEIVPGHQDYVAGLPFTGNVDSSVNIVSASMRYTW